MVGSARGVGGEHDETPAVITPPTGTVTFLFTDVEGSTRLWDTHPEAMTRALQRHDAIMRNCIEEYGGYVFSTAGDAFSAAFSRADSAAAAASDAQVAFAAESWPDDCHIRVRMGLHSSEAQERDGDYFGSALNRAARMMAIGHGEQILVSNTTQAVLRDGPLATSLIPLGHVKLKGLSRPEGVFELRYPGLVREFPPLVSYEPIIGKLPAVADDLVGRLEDLRTVVKLIGEHDVVTLLGPGGVGKTRLSIEAATAVRNRFDDGAWFAELASVTDGDDVVRVLAELFGVQATTRRALTDSIVAALAGRQMLVVLDNCEHVLDAAAAIETQLRNGCPELKILATSREPLRVAGEHVHTISPLPIRVDDPAEQSPAVELFLLRAQAADSAFEIDEVGLRQVVDVCEVLDGLPLAIELAAARVRGVGLDALAERIGDHKQLLRARRGRVKRHESLRDVVQWSYDLLDDGLKAIFCRAGIFAGGFTLDAAEQVLAFGNISELDVTEGVVDLVDKSMIERLTSTATPRYRMLEAMRQFAAAAVDVGDRLETERRFVEHFVSWAETVCTELERPGMAGWMWRAGEELDNFREVHRLAMASDDIDSAARLVVALRDFSALSVIGEPEVWAMSVAEKIDETSPYFADALSSALHGARGRGDLDSAVHLLERIDRASEAGLVVPSAFSDQFAAITKWFLRDTAESIRLHQRALGKAHDTGDLARESEILASLAMVQDSFDREAAEASARRSIELARQHGTFVGLNMGLLALAGVLLHKDPGAATKVIDELLELADHSGSRWHQATGLRIKAHALSRAGDLEAASRTYARALELNGIGDFGELLWYTVINVVEHLHRIDASETAAIALGAFMHAPSAPVDDLIQRAITRLRSALADQLGAERIAQLEAEGVALNLASLLRLLQSELQPSATLSR